MKSLLSIITVLVLIVPSVIAQDNPYLSAGRSLVGGGLSLSIDSHDPNNDDPALETANQSFDISVSPTYGKFFRDRWVAGVSLTIGHQNSRNEITSESTLRENSSQLFSIGITPFVRRYFPITERFGAYLQPEVSYMYQRTATEQERRDTDQPAANSFTSATVRRHVGSLGTRAGLYYFITEHFSVETNLLQAAFTISRSGREDTTIDNTVNQTTEGTQLRANLSLINELSLDRILVLNYYF